MTKLRCIAPPGTTADWEERLYHISIPVIRGELETDDEIAIQTLVRRGTFEIVEDVAPVAVDPVHAAAPAAVAQPRNSRQRKAVEKGT